MFAQTGRPTRTAAAPLCLIVMSVVLSALTGAEAFDLSGVATGFSPAPLGDRYFAQPLQAGAGSAPTAWTVTCVSLNCGWSTVTLRLTGGAGVSFRAEGVINAMTGTIHTNPTTGETVVEWSNDTTWVWFKVRSWSPRAHLAAASHRWARRAPPTRRAPPQGCGRAGRRGSPRWATRWCWRTT